MYLVTGGSGFIGAAVVKQLVKCGKKVVVFSRSGSKERLIGMDQDVEFVQGDVHNFSRLLEVLSRYKITCIIHLAFYTDILQLENSPQKGVDINCTGFMNILEAARALKIPKVVWTSSAAVYGEDERYIELPISEDNPKYPLNVYGTYKVFCESIAEHYHYNLGVENISLRPTIVFGSGRWFRGAATYAYDLFYGPAMGKTVTLDCGDQLGDWLYVKDLAQALFLASVSGNLQHRVFNVCGHLTSVREAAGIMNKLYPTTEFNVLPGKRSMWGPHLDSTLAEKELGYKPSCTLADAFRECVEEIRSIQRSQGGLLS